MPDTYSISDLAKEFEVTTRALRFYQDKGILSPARQGQTRLYSERDRVRLKLTLRGKRIGLTLEEILEIIDLYDSSKVISTKQLLLVCSKIRVHRGQLLAKLADLEATLLAMDEVEGKCHEQLQELHH